MNLVIVILVVILLWFLYSLLQSFRNIETQLREIKTKCVIDGSSHTGSKDPVDSMQSNIISGLSALKQYAKV